VSRLDQDPRLQEDETLAFVERRGWKLVDTFVDHGVSGSREKRPALDRMLADAKKGRFDAVLVWRSDRLFRSLRHMVNTLAELDVMGISFVSVTEPFDGTSPQGKLLIHLVSAFSEFERQVLIE
jgi:site-specific DNA recombinase